MPTRFSLGYANSYVLKSFKTGDRAALDTGIDRIQKAMAGTKPGHRDYAQCLFLLTNAFRLRFERSGDLRDLNTAVAMGQAAVDASSGGHPVDPGLLSNLGCAYMNRFEAVSNLSDCDDAIAAFKAAMAASKVKSAVRVAVMSNLATTLRRRSERTGDPGELEALYLSNLGSVLRMRFEHSRSEDDLNEAIAVGQNAAASELASPMVRTVAAYGWGMAAALGDRRQEAVDGFATAVGLLPKVAPRSLTRSDREHQLDNVSGIGPDAAACCVRAGQLAGAVELFEQGRGILLGQALDARTDITALAESHEDLAGEFTALLNRLDRGGFSREGPASARADKQGTVGQASLHVESQREAADALDQVIARIREQPGFEHFLVPATLAELSAAATEGRIVLVIVSRLGSNALILTPEGVKEPIPLPALDPESVLKQVTSFLAALDEASVDAREERFEETLGWLWEAVAGPVFERLGIAGPPEEGEPWPRVWWCPSGLLSLLPLHAAGPRGTEMQDSSAGVIDRVISSYTPTVRALIHARRTAQRTPGIPAEKAADAGRRLVAVAMPSTPGERDLPEAQAEATGLRDLFPGQVTIMAGPAATHETVITALPSAVWAHFACHGSSDLANPAESTLLLYDYRERPLKIPDIAGLNLADAELAFLSACSTARIGGRLADEAIHLVSAFQLAGYRQVIGTLWPIEDPLARQVAGEIYAALARGETTAAAVHEVTRHKSRRWFDRPSQWASHVHVGA